MFRLLSTERLARTSARRPKLTLLAWLGAFLAAAAAVALLLGSSLTTDDDFTNRPESKRAGEIVEAALPIEQRRNDFHADATVVVHVSKSGDRPLRDLSPSVQAVYRRIAAIPPAEAIRAVRHPFQRKGGERSLLSADGRTALIQLHLGFAPDEFVEQLVDTVDAVTGERIVDLDLERTAEADLVRGELIGLAAALVVLLVVFGSLVASLVPLAVAVVSIVIALGLTTLVGQAWELAFFVVRRPLVSLAASVAVLVALAAPYAWVQTGSSGVSTLPDSFASKRAFELLEQGFGARDNATAEVVVAGKVASQPVQAADRVPLVSLAALVRRQ